MFAKIPRLVGSKLKYSNVDRDKLAKDLRQAMDLLCRATIARRFGLRFNTDIPSLLDTDMTYSDGERRPLRLLSLPRYLLEQSRRTVSGKPGEVISRNRHTPGLDLMHDAFGSLPAHAALRPPDCCCDRRRAVAGCFLEERLSNFSVRYCCSLVQLTLEVPMLPFLKVADQDHVGQAQVGGLKVGAGLLSR